MVQLSLLNAIFNGIFSEPILLVKGQACVFWLYDEMLTLNAMNAYDYAFISRPKKSRPTNIGKNT